MELTLDIGLANIAKKGEELCGDVVEIKKAHDSSVIVLSDGLGSGVKANILGTLTSKIATNLLAKGVALQDVVETIAETLPVCKVRQLAYSTFTILQVFNGGRTYIAQFDNPAVIYIHDRNIKPIEGKVRTIAGRKISEKTINLAEGDILISVSDGVTHAGIGALMPLGLGMEGIVEILESKIDLTKDSQCIAEEILDFCQAYSWLEPGDDITVAVVKMRKPVKGVVLSGPPLVKEDDADIVEYFFSGKKRRVICGGTTANIVAREKDLRLNISKQYEDRTLPPMAYLEGVDFVTEGILTLTRVVEILENGMVHNCNKMNGASRLLRWFLACDEIELLVGLRVNPAHLDPELPFHLGMRSSLLQKLRDLLTARGKKVTIRWF